MRKTITMGLLLLYPGLAWGQTCEFDLFEQLTNQFYDRVYNEFGEPGESHSIDFARYEPLWVRTQAQADQYMSPDMQSVYEKYREAYERLDKIYGANPSNPRLRNFYQCQQKFYIEEIFNAFFPGGIGSISPNCGDENEEVSLDDLERAQLIRELSLTNLYTCKYEAGEAEDPASFATPRTRSNSVAAEAPATISVDQSRFDLTADQVEAIRASTSVDANTAPAEADMEVEESTLQWWQRLQNFFGFGETPEANTGQSSQGRATNFIANEEIDAATRSRNAAWQNNRNYWVQRGIKSAQLLDVYETRFDEEILVILDELNTSLEESLAAMSDVCARQRTDEFCWGNRNRYRSRDLWSPKDSIN